MDKYHLHWFTDEINMHVWSALASYDQLLTTLASPKTRQSRIVWFQLLSFLTHTAMVSKFFNPVESSKKERGQILKAHLDITDDSILLPRAARNNLEHIDERIDRWAQEGDKAVLEIVLDDRVGFDFIAKRDPAIRRVLIQDEMVFISEDQNGNRIETELDPIRKALLALQSRCEHKLRTESPYNYLLAQALRN